MKTMTCLQLGGACNKNFTARTFKEIAELSKQHGIEMFHKNDKAHIEAMSKMQLLMKEPKVMQTWFQSKQEEFNNLPFNE